MLRSILTSIDRLLDVQITSIDRLLDVQITSIDRLLDVQITSIDRLLDVQTTSIDRLLDGHICPYNELVVIQSISGQTSFPELLQYLWLSLVTSIFMVVLSFFNYARDKINVELSKSSHEVRHDIGRGIDPCIPFQTSSTSSSSPFEA